MTRPIWLDCDPGHDDAVAMLMAIHSTNVQLLGVSTVNYLKNVDHSMTHTVDRPTATPVQSIRIKMLSDYSMHLMPLWTSTRTVVQSNPSYEM
jgi:inosine-uridine nucleoside N-ribohydrolase